ncbi:tripartite tricarboxylate transporter TctB family protein [Geodermatophilus sp. SYSU D01176]
MTSPSGGTHVPERPGGHTAAGASPESAPPPPAGSADHGFDLEEAIHQVEAEEHEGRPPAAGTLGNVVVAAVVVALGAAAVLGSLPLDVGSAAAPEAGTWPLLISVVIVVLGLGLLAVVRRTTDAERFGRTSLLVLAGLATMVVFVAVLPVIGFEIPAALLAFVWLRFLGHEGWRTSIITSLAVVVAFYLIFVAALSVPIPHLF